MSVDSNLSLGLLSRLELLGTHERVDEARAYFARSFGRNPEGVILVDGDGRIVGLDSGACDLLDVDPRRALGLDAREYLLDDSAQFVSSWMRDAGGEIAGLFSKFEESTFGVTDEPMGFSGVLEELFEFDTLEELMEWFGFWAGDLDAGRGAIALRDGAWMHVWCAWPSGLGSILPIRFRAMDARAFRNGRDVAARDELVCGFDEGTLIPLIIDGTVSALVALEGDQLEVQMVLDQLAMALRRFVE